MFGSDDEEEGDKADRSIHQDIFDSEGEEEEDVGVDLEYELVSALEELQNVKNDFKIYKISVLEDCSQLRTCLHVSNQKVSLLTSQIEETKILTDDLKSVLDCKESERENLRNEYKLFKNVAIVEKNQLTKCLEEYEECISELKSQA